MPWANRARGRLRAEYREAAGWLGMSPELLERVYGHHPDYQRDVAEKMSGTGAQRRTKGVV
jgi:hypothetical protein